MRKIIGRLLLFILFVSAYCIPFMQLLMRQTTKVYKVPIEKAVEKGLYAFLQRSFSEAEEAERKQSFLKLIHQVALRCGRENCETNG